MTAEFTFVEEPSAVDPSRPLIYLWRIFDSDGSQLTCYVGKAKGGAYRPRRVYANNIRKLRTGSHWHNQPGKRYRSIHYAMSEAVDSGHRVVLTLVRNVEPWEDINEVERVERIRYRCPGT